MMRKKYEKEKVKRERKKGRKTSARGKEKTTMFGYCIGWSRR